MVVLALHQRPLRFVLFCNYYVGYFEEKKKHWMDSKIDEERIKFVATFEQAAVGIAHVSPEGKWITGESKIMRYYRLYQRRIVEQNVSGYHPFGGFKH